MGNRPKKEEEWACRIIERELERTVILHDDGSQLSMFDLRIGSAYAPEAAIECVAAVDQVAIETWNVGPGRGPLKLGIEGDWRIEIASECNVKMLQKGIATLLHEMERCKCYNTYGSNRSMPHDERLSMDMNRLGVVNAYCYRRHGSGVVHWSTSGIGGMVDESGAAVAGWISAFLREPARQDVLLKLARSGAPIREVFVFVVESGAPWLVTSYLDGDFSHTPGDAPDLPWPVTGVWALSVFGRRGIRWNGDSWQVFGARGEGIELVDGD